MARQKIGKPYDFLWLNIIIKVKFSFVCKMNANEKRQSQTGDSSKRKKHLTSSLTENPISLSKAVFLLIFSSFLLPIQKF